jgi:hypothetical protein
MGSKSKAPPPPDYTGAAMAQAQASKENLNIQNFANRPTINTPWGSESWQTSATTDPATGQRVTSWTQNTTLNPNLQQALDSQIGIQQGRSDLASAFMGRVQDEYRQPFDFQNLPALTSAGTPGQLQTGVADYTPGLQTGVNTQGVVSGFGFGGPQMGVDAMTGGLARSTGRESVQRGLATGDNPALPQVNNTFRNEVASDLMAQMLPVQRMQQQALETDLSNRGFKVGTRGYQRALDDLNARQAGERYNALAQAGQEASRLFGMQMGSRQQAFNEDVTGGQFANAASNQAFQQGLAADQFQNQTVQQAFNQALGAGRFGNEAQSQYFNQMMNQADLANRAGQQAFNQNLAAAQFGNQALNQAQGLDISRMQAMNQASGQQFNQNLQYANMMNQLRQQAIAEQMQRRGMSLNEMNALLTGQQVGMPQMPRFNASGVAETPQLLQAANMGYQAQLDSFNAQQQGLANTLGGIGNIASTAFMFSDRRLKRNIKRVGTHDIGVGIYEYDMGGYRQRGVMAQEVEAVRPDLVKRHASGYLMVNYGALA